MRWIAVCSLVLMGLAGCADDAGEPEDDEFDDFDESLTATDDTGIIRGVVVDTSITPVPEVTITIVQTGDETLTNENGAFGFAGLDPGFYHLQPSKLGYNGTQTQVEVTAGVDDPPVLKIQLTEDQSAAPFIQPMYMQGYLTCGAAVFRTSVGCTTVPLVAEAIGDQSVFPVDYDRIPDWVQAELVWESTQSLSGAFIWEITPQGSNTHFGYRETAPSPALAYLDNATLAERGGDLLDPGINLRFFGGPHELCPATGDPNKFGCGVTIEQRTEVFAHNFYNFIPDEGWRFTADGDHPLPA